MASPVSTYLTVLLLGIVLTVLVGQVLIRSSRPVLADVFREPETARSVTRLLVVLFHLVVLGVIALVASIDITLAHPVQTIVVRLGLVLLVLGAAHGGTLFLLTRLRARRRMQLRLEERTAQAEQARQAQAQQHRNPGMGAPYPNSQPSPAQTYPVAEPGPGL